MTRRLVITSLLLWVAGMHGLGAAAAVGGPAPGRPAVVVPGGLFGVGEGAGETVTLIRGLERYPLPVVAPKGALPIGAGHVRIPEELPAGRYEFVAGPADESTLPSGRVHVLPEFPEAYSVAVVRRDSDGQPGAAVFSESLVSEVRATDAALVFLVGTLTTDGQEASYVALEAQWSEMAVPVFYCPDGEEVARCRAAGNPIVSEHAFSFGKDGYMLFGAGLSQTDVGVDGRMGAIHRWRRALRASRWSVGVTGRFGLDWSIRSQLVLFVDDPLDYLVSGEMVPGVGETLPWGRTRYAIPSTAPVLPLQLFTVDGGAMRAVVAPAGSKEPEAAAAE